MREQYANKASTTLAADITSAATSLSVNDASAFPTSGQFRILVDNEILLVTGVSVATFTVSRAQEGTTAASHIAPAAVTCILTRASLLQVVADNVPLANCSTRPPFRLLDSSGGALSSSSFGQLNAATGVVISDRDDGSISMVSTPGGTTGVSLVALTRPIPATQQLVCGVRPILQQGASAAWSMAGCGFYDSVSGKSTLLGCQSYNGGFHTTARRFDTPTTNGAAVFDEPLWIPGADAAFFKLASDGSTLTYFVGNGDASDWVQVFSEAVGSYYSPTHFLWGANNKGSLPLVCRLVCWAEG